MKKVVTLIFTVLMLFSLSACLLDFKHTDTEQSSFSESGNSNIESFSSEDSSVYSSSASSSSSKPHIHSYSKMLTNISALKTEATLYKPAVYYYSCDCGLVNKDNSASTFEYGHPLDYDYDILDEYISYLVDNASPSNPIWDQEGHSNSWNYIDGCMMTSLYKLYEQTNDSTYYNFVKNYIDYFINADGSIKTFSESSYNLDNINEGRVLYDLYKKTNNNKYLLAINTLNNQLKNQPRTSLQSFWHKKTYKNQVWLDGLYMAQPFALRYQTEISTESNYSDILLQYGNVEQYMKDSSTGLYYHGFDVTKAQRWADSDTGLSQCFWLRSIGWYTASLSDIYYYLPENENEIKTTIATYLKGAIDSLLNYLNTEKYMFYQVVDQGTRSGNYLETSGSALICYAILNGVNAGALPQEYFNIGKAIFNGICSNNLTRDDNDELALGNICKTAGLGGSPYRDGSYEYYIGEKIVSTDAKGVAPLIMSYVELLKHAENN